MKSKLFTILFVAALCTAGLSSCSDENIAPADEVKKEKGAQGVEDGF
jgi:ABC-type Fe3+-citrate transport system substrate-binding protein